MYLKLKLDNFKLKYKKYLECIHVVDDSFIDWTRNFLKSYSDQNYNGSLAPKG